MSRKRSNIKKIPLMVKVPESDKNRWVKFAQEKGFNGYTAMVREAVRQMMARESDELDIEGRLSREIRELRTDLRKRNSGVYNAVRLNSAQVAALHRRLFMTLGDFANNPNRFAMMPEFDHWLHSTVTEIYREDQGWHRKMTDSEDNVVEVRAVDEEQVNVNA